MSNVISVENIGKKYLISHQGREPYTALRDVLADGARAFYRRLFSPGTSQADAQAEEFWALKDVSFEVKQGDRIGIIGRNGAGKSTLLKILSRITEPTEGRVRIRGRVASLLEVGTGFHPELTGRENIFLNGAILGMHRVEIARKFDEIVAFAEIEKFLDTPVKRYSSGMYVRLAFAVAAHLEPEILIVDEVLAVGDAQFQKKCLGKMEEVGKEGRTVLFVSHNMGAIHTLTQNCAFLGKGKLLFFGETLEAVGKYLSESVGSENEKKYNLDFYRREYVEKAYEDNVKVRYTDIWVEKDGERISELVMGDRLDIFFELEVYSQIHGANLSFSILNAEAQFVSVIFSWDNDYYIDLPPGKHVIKLEIEDFVLTPGQYLIISGINQTAVTTPWDAIFHYPLFEVVNCGKIVHWLHRPWGVVHCDRVQWSKE
ncbi:ABC transporter ATP-binding protein [Geobacter anodireducens]|uniref:ABC transporter ATP-binding protein n=1 Tax=Geobacter soli TaxID=1510391 RepID=UPI0009E55135|nr:polysaccharide ABC transporter ATP-binding protein [Geobacter soli]